MILETQDIDSIKSVKITMIEDSRETAQQFLDAMESNTNIIVSVQSINVTPFFDKAIERSIISFNPDLIVLDLRLEKDTNDSGLRVLRQLKSSDRLSNIPVVVYSKYIFDKTKTGEKYSEMVVQHMQAAGAVEKGIVLRAEDFLSHIPGFYSSIHA